MFYTPLIVAHFGGHLDVFFAFALILVFANVSILFAHTRPGCSGLNPMAQYFESRIIRKRKLNSYIKDFQGILLLTCRIIDDGIEKQVPGIELASPTTVD